MSENKKSLFIKADPSGIYISDGEKEVGPFTWKGEVDYSETGKFFGVEGKKVLELIMGTDPKLQTWMQPPNETVKGEVEEAQLTYEKLELVNLAFDVVETGNPEPQLCVATPQTVSTPKKNKKGEIVDYEKKVMPVLVFSPSRKAYLADKETLTKLGLQTYLPPEVVNPRWSVESFKAWKQGWLNPKPTPRSVYWQLKKEFEYYLDCVEVGMYWYIPLWIMGTYFYQLFETYPRLGLTGTKESGKSKVLKFIYCTAFNAEWTMNISTSALFRTAQGTKGCLVCDEQESLADKERRTELRGLINASYEKGVYAKRTNKNTGKQERYDVYVPIAIGSIQGFEDVLESRAVVFTMLRTADSEKANRQIEVNDPKWQKLRDQLHVLQMEEWKKVQSLYNEEQYPYELKGRDWQLWKPMFTLAYWIDDPHLLANLQNLAEKKTGYRQEKDQLESDELILLQALKENLMEDGWWRISDIKMWMEEAYGDEAPSRIQNTQYIIRLLRRLNWEKFRKESNRWVCLITKAEVEDRCKRYNVLKEET